MAISELPDFDNDDDSDKRRKFVSWVEETLSNLVGDEYQGLFVERLRIPMRNAWEDRNQIPLGFDALGDAVSGLNSDQVQSHGLAGHQLDFKLATVRHWAGRFHDDPDVGILRRLLDAIDNLLDSLLDAIGAGSALSELKDAIRDALDE